MRFATRLWLRDWAVRGVALLIIAAQASFGAAVMLRLPDARGFLLGGFVLGIAASNFRNMLTWWRNP